MNLKRVSCDLSGYPFYFARHFEICMKPTFVLDIGNTRIKCGIFLGSQLKEVHIANDLDEIESFLSTFDIVHGIVCNVGRSEDSLKEFRRRWTGLIFLHHSTPIPFPNQYATPQTLGLDRLAAAVGAWTLFPEQACLIVDVGTALKMDYVLPDQGFMGGYISPGLRIRFEGLHSFTNRLPLITPKPFAHLYGQSTQDCILAGVMQGMLAEIEGIVQKYEKLHPITVVFSGGDAHFFESQIKTTKFTEPNLVLIGLHRILQHNVNEPNQVL